MGPIVVVVLAATVLVLAIGGLMGLGIRGERRTTSFEQTRAVQRVEVVVPSGAVHFVASAGPVRVERRIRWMLARPVSTETLEGGVLRLETRADHRWQRGGEASYRVEVPAGLGVRASTGAGEVSAEGMRSEVRLHTGAGRINLSNLAGSVRADTRAGAVRGSHLSCRDLDVETNAGAVELTFSEPPDRVEARSNAGAVEITLPDASYDVQATGVGEVLVDVVNDPSATRRVIAHANAGSVQVLGQR
jgi:hypothetical protein